MKRKTIARKEHIGVLSKKTDVKLRFHQYRTLTMLKDGHYIESISRQMKVPRETVRDRVNRLHELGLVKIDVKTTAIFYRLTKKGYEAIKYFHRRSSRYPRQKGKTRLHRLNVKFKILKDNEKAVFDSEYQLNNWVQKYLKVKFPIGITIKKTPKSIIAMFHEFETSNSRVLDDFFNHVMRGVNYVYYYCMKKLQIELDIFDMEILDQHIVNEKPELQGKIEESKTTTIDLERKAKAYFKTNLKAKAWLDHSKGTPEIETNDFLYEEKLLAVPERVEMIEKTIVPVIHELARQIALHMEVLNDMRGSLKEMRKYYKRKKD